jgi:hypothetical protein
LRGISSWSELAIGRQCIGGLNGCFDLAALIGSCGGIRNPWLAVRSARPTPGQYRHGSVRLVVANRAGGFTSVIDLFRTLMFAAAIGWHEVLQKLIK